MRSKEELNKLLEDLQKSNEQALEFDRERIDKAYYKANEKQTFSIKLLSVLGGVLANFMFVGFLLMLGLNDSEIGLITIGVSSIAFAVILSEKLDLIIYDTLSASFFIIGFSLTYLGLGKFIQNENIIYLIGILLALISLYFTRNYMLSFISVIIVNLGVALLILTNNKEDFINIYVVVLIIGFAYLLLNEAKIIKRSIALSKLYNPLKTSILLSLIALLSIQSSMSYLDSAYIWLCSVIIILCILYFLSKIFKELGINEKKDQVNIYILSGLILLPTILSPAFSGAILIILLSFFINYKTGFVIGVLSWIYFLSKFYYDLEFSLLIKSILLFTSGLFFLLLYFLINKRLSVHEKV